MVKTIYYESWVLNKRWIGHINPSRADFMSKIIDKAKALWLKLRIWNYIYGMAKDTYNSTAEKVRLSATEVFMTKKNKISIFEKVAWNKF